MINNFVLAIMSIAGIFLLQYCVLNLKLDYIKLHKKGIKHLVFFGRFAFIFHEYAHYVMAKMLGFSVDDFHPWEVKTGDDSIVSTGSMHIERHPHEKASIDVLWVGIAPLLFGLILSTFLLGGVQSNFTGGALSTLQTLWQNLFILPYILVTFLSYGQWLYIVRYLLVIYLMYGMSLSYQDVHGAILPNLKKFMKHTSFYFTIVGYIIFSLIFSRELYLFYNMICVLIGTFVDITVIRYFFNFIFHLLAKKFPIFDKLI